MHTRTQRAPKDLGIQGPAMQPSRRAPIAPGSLIYKLHVGRDRCRESRSVLDGRGWSLFVRIMGSSNVCAQRNRGSAHAHHALFSRVASDSQPPQHLCHYHLPQRQKAPRPDAAGHAALPARDARAQQLVRAALRCAVLCVRAAAACARSVVLRIGVRPWTRGLAAAAVAEQALMLVAGAQPGETRSRRRRTLVYLDRRIDRRAHHTLHQ